MRCRHALDNQHVLGRSNATSRALSPDTTARRVHGLKSGKMLKEFLGHTSYANDAIYSPDGSQIVSAASDGTVRVWEAKSCEQLRAFKCASTLEVTGLQR